MPEIFAMDMNGNELEKINLSSEIFGINPNKTAMHMAVVCYLAAQRQGNKSALTRAEVRGGGAKPWRQKGTGRARQGSIRAPQWRHGGVVFAPKPRDFSFSINKKVRRLAMKSAFSFKFLKNEIVLLDNLVLESIKTKEMNRILKKINADKKACIILPGIDNKIIKSARNIEGVTTTQIENLSTYKILYSGKLIFTKASLQGVEEVYA